MHIGAPPGPGDDELAAAAAALAVPPGCDPLLETARGGLPTTQDWTWRTKDGDRRPVALRVTPVRDSRSPTGFVITATERVPVLEPVPAGPRSSGERLLLELDDAPTRTLRWQVGGGWRRRR